MPKHTFKFSSEFLSLLRQKIADAFVGLQPERFGQEPKYTSAVLGRLHGIEVENSYGEYVKIEATDIDDRGANSAESRYGADFAITATVRDSKRTIRKAILVQVKNQPIDSLSPSQERGLKEQIQKMKNVVSAPKVAGIRRDAHGSMLEVSSGNKILRGEDYSKSDFPAYFNQRVITTLDGTTDKKVIDALQASDLRKLDVIVKAIKNLQPTSYLDG